MHGVVRGSIPATLVVSDWLRQRNFSSCCATASWFVVSCVMFNRQIFPTTLGASDFFPKTRKLFAAPGF